MVVKVYQEPSGGPWTPLLATFSFFTTAAQSTPNPCWLILTKAPLSFSCFTSPVNHAMTKMPASYWDRNCF